MRMVIARKDLEAALQWLERVSKMTRETTVTMRHDEPGRWEWTCGGQSRGMPIEGTWEKVMLSPVLPLMMLKDSLSEGAMIEFDVVEKGYTVDGITVRVERPTGDTPRIELPVNATPAMTLALIQELGGDRLSQAGYAGAVSRAIALRRELSARASVTLAPFGVSVGAIERLIDEGIRDPRAGLDADERASRVTAAARAFEQLSALGVRWEDLWAEVNKGR